MHSSFFVFVSGKPLFFISLRNVLELLTCKAPLKCAEFLRGGEMPNYQNKSRGPQIMSILLLSLLLGSMLLTTWIFMQISNWTSEAMKDGIVSSMSQKNTIKNEIIVFYKNMLYHFNISFNIYLRVTIFECVTCV